MIYRGSKFRFLHTALRGDVKILRDWAEKSGYFLDPPSLHTWADEPGGERKLHVNGRTRADVRPDELLENDREKLTRLRKYLVGIIVVARRVIEAIDARVAELDAADAARKTDAA